MYRKHCSKGISLVAFAFVSAGCFGQQIQEANRSSAPLPPYGIAPSQNAIPSTAPIALNPVLRVLAPKPESAKGVPVLRALFGQRTDFGVFTVGNFNPVSYITIHVNEPAISSNRSSLGGGAEYRRWFSDRNALGVLYTQNPSNGKLFWQGQNYIWPDMRYDFSILATQRFKVKNVEPFLSEGPGVVLTNGYGNCGWSGGFAFVTGFGTELQLSRQISARTGITFLNTRGGCYDDPTCLETWGVVEDLRIGVAYKWGAEYRSDVLR